VYENIFSYFEPFAKFSKISYKIQHGYQKMKNFMTISSQSKKLQKDFLEKSTWVSENEEFHDDCESVKKFQNDSCKKVIGIKV
jgi:hypothetical protein